MGAWHDAESMGNAFTYAGANPFNRTDALGLDDSLFDPRPSLDPPTSADVDLMSEGLIDLEGLYAWGQVEIVTSEDGKVIDRSPARGGYYAPSGFATRTDPRNPYADRNRQTVEQAVTLFGRRLQDELAGLLEADEERLAAEFKAGCPDGARVEERPGSFEMGKVSIKFEALGPPLPGEEAATLVPSVPSEGPGGYTPIFGTWVAIRATASLTVTFDVFCDGRLLGSRNVTHEVTFEGGGIKIGGVGNEVLGPWPSSNPPYPDLPDDVLEKILELR